MGERGFPARKAAARQRPPRAFATLIVATLVRSTLIPASLAFLSVSGPMAFAQNAGALRGSDDAEAAGSTLGASTNTGRATTTSTSGSAIGRRVPAGDLFTPGARPPLRTGSPALEPTRRPVERLGAPGVQRTVSQPVATLADPAIAPPPLRRRRADENPYDPIGIRSGGLLFLPAIEQSAGWDSNPNRAARAKGSALLRTDAELRLQSDWSQHQLTGALRGSYFWYPDASEANRPEVDGRIAYRHDFSRTLEGEVELRGRLDTQRPGSPELNVAVRDRPLVASLGTTLGATQRFNRLSMRLRGTLDRTAYEDARLSNGNTLSQRDRDLTQYGAELRVGYEVTPGLIPFAEALTDTRRYDLRRDNAGFRRDSVGVGGRVGTTFEITRTLTGEVAAGWRTRRYDDARLSDLNGAVADGTLLWSISPITTLRLNLATTLDETTIVGSSGAVTNRAGIELTHDFQRHITLTTGVTAGRSDYRGVRLTEDTIAATARLDYRFGRSLILRASYQHERGFSTAVGSDYKADVWLLGLRLQR